MHNTTANRNRFLLAVYILLIGFQILFGYFFNVHFSFSANLFGPSTVKPKIQKHILLPGQGNTLQNSERAKNLISDATIDNYSPFKRYGYNRFGFACMQENPATSVFSATTGRAPPLFS